MIIALEVALALSVLALVFWCLGAGAARRAAFEQAAGVLRGEAARRALDGEGREAVALRFGAHLVEGLHER